MAVSAFDLFKVGIGPSSSHTVGPMRAARMFAAGIAETPVTRVLAELFGSLGATGHGHGSEKAVLLGLEGERPETVDTTTTTERTGTITHSGRLTLNRQPGPGYEIDFGPDDLVMHRSESLPGHPNGMRFRAWNHDTLIADRTFYSIGGGFVIEESPEGLTVAEDATALPFPYRTGAELLEVCFKHRLSIPEVALANERARRSDAEIRQGLLDIWQVMKDCVAAGCASTGVLPGGLKVRRRAAALHRRLVTTTAPSDPLVALDWVSLWALAVNEENAAGGRVVTAPTNGAAGIIPAVLYYVMRYVPGADDDTVIEFLLTAAAIGAVFQQTGSISGAEVGCQGEVGVACSMAAAGIAHVLGATPRQVTNAAEIGLEHHLGLTCDPVGGLVQIPCIERNAVGSVKAITAARLALAGDEDQKVSLDQVIKTMMQTGADMKIKYKETARGGLAVNIVEC